MAQKEVIHLTVGTFSQHISTHFFNQQSSHFQYDERKSENNSNDDLPLDPNVDFQEGIGSRRNEQTFFPREVVVGFRGDLGTGWDAYEVTMEEDEEGEAGLPEDYDVILKPSNAINEGLHAWSRPAELLLTGSKGRVRQSRAFVDSSEYDEDLSASETEEERESTPPTESSPNQSEGKKSKKHAKQTRYRTPASYATNPHHPRSLFPLPRLYGSGSLMPMGSIEDAEGSNPFSTFEMGMTLAKEMDREASMSEDCIRWFAEDSDSLQSFQVTTNISDGFSGYSHEVLQTLADEYPKTPVITWGAQWGSVQEDGEGKSGRLGRLRQMNNILSLWSLSSSSFYIPLQIPEYLSQSKKQKGPLHCFSSRVDWTDEYQASALLSAHIDTATLRMRLRNPELNCSAASLIASLNWRRDTPIGSLGGCIPIPLLAPFSKQGASMDPIEALLASRGYGSREKGRNERNFETPQERAAKAASQIQKHFINLSSSTQSTMKVNSNFAENIVARDNDKLAAAPTREALEAWSHLQDPVGQSTFVDVPFHIQSAFYPQMFRNLTSTGRPIPEGYNNDVRSKVHSVPMLSSLSTSSATASLLRQARRYLDNKIIKGHESLQLFGVGGGRGSSAGQAANEESEGPLGGRDGMIEIRERLEELLGAYEGSDDDNDDDVSDKDRLDTDEEYDDQVEEWVLDDD